MLLAVAPNFITSFVSVEVSASPIRFFHILHVATGKPQLIGCVLPAISAHKISHFCRFSSLICGFKGFETLWLEFLQFVSQPNEMQNVKKSDSRCKDLTKFLMHLGPIPPLILWHLCSDFSHFASDPREPKIYYLGPVERAENNILLLYRFSRLICGLKPLNAFRSEMLKDLKNQLKPQMK